MCYSQEVKLPPRYVHSMCYSQEVKLPPRQTSVTFSVNAPTEAFPWEDMCKILHGRQQITKIRNGEKYCRNFQPPE